VECPPYGSIEKFAAIFPHPGSSKPPNSASGTLRHSIRSIPSSSW
jgi:hypothetical protein